MTIGIGLLCDDAMSLSLSQEDQEALVSDDAIRHLTGTVDRGFKSLLTMLIIIWLTVLVKL